MRYRLDLRTLAYLVSAPLLAAGLFDLLGTVHVQSGYEAVSCGSVVDSGVHTQECDDALSNRGIWSYPVGIAGGIGLLAAFAVARKPGDDEEAPAP